MGINFWYVQAGLFAAALCISSFFSLLLPPCSYASELIHTVQTGSFTNPADALVQYDFIMHTLSGKKPDGLRIERIGKFYAVRIGRFKDRTDTEGLLREMKSHFTDVLVMEAYIKDERIIRINTVRHPAQNHITGEQSAPGLDNGNNDPVTAVEAESGKKTELIAAVRAENMEIDNLEPPSSLKRDLFSSGISVHTLNGRAEEETLKKLELTATIIDDREPLAIIGDEVLGIGGSIEGLKVTAIQNNEVVLSKGGRRYILKIKKE